MNRTILSFATAATLGVGALFATTLPSTSYADDGTAPPVAGQQRERGEWGGRFDRHGGHRGGMARGRMALERAAARNPNIAVMIDARQLERAYRADGRVKEVPALYRELIGKSTDPHLTRMLNQRLARVEMHDGNRKAAIDALRLNLDADLKRAAAAK